MAYHARGGLDFNALSRGNEKSYSTSYLVDMEPDLLNLCSTGKKETAFDLSKKVLVGHTKRIFRQLFARSRRDVQQICFGTAFVQLNPNFRRFERMDPNTWKKEGIISAWNGLRGLRKSCCKNCCVDRGCQVSRFRTVEA